MTHPIELVDKLGGGNVAVSLGNFGHIQYGTTINAQLYRPDHNEKACKKFDTFFPANSMVLVDAGKCPITQKVRHIEQAGGQVALIGDSIQENVEDVFMEDVDGSGFSLTIPALLIDL